MRNKNQTGIVVTKKMRKASRYHNFMRNSRVHSCHNKKNSQVIDPKHMKAGAANSLMKFIASVLKKKG